MEKDLKEWSLGIHLGLEEMNELCRMRCARVTAGTRMLFFFKVEVFCHHDHVSPCFFLKLHLWIDRALLGIVQR